MPKQRKPAKAGTTPVVPARKRTTSNAHRDLLSRQLVQELEMLRQMLEVMAEQYRVRVGGQIQELLQRAYGDPSLSQRPRVFTVKAAEAMLVRIRSADLKPKKGRAKDFARMQELVAELTELVPPEG